MTQQAPVWLDRQQPNALNCFRLIFATAVLFDHNWTLGGFGHNPLSDLFSPIGGLGAAAVDGFFIISGFLIMGSWLSRRNAESFLRARVVRIWPAFAVAFIISALIAALGSGHQWLQYIRSIPGPSWLVGIFTLNQTELNRALSFAHNPYPTVVNGSMWTIQIEFICYLVVALVGSIGGFRRRWLVIIFTSFSICLAASEDRILPAAWMHWPRFASFFGAGALFYLFHMRIPKNGWLALGCVASLLTGRYFSHFFTMPIAGTYIILYAAYTAPDWIKRIGAKNDISYGLYLYAFPVQQFIFSQIGGSEWFNNPWFSFAIAFMCCLGFGWLSWLFVEKPSKAFMKASINRHCWHPNA